MRLFKRPNETFTVIFVLPSFIDDGFFKKNFPFVRMYSSICCEKHYRSGSHPNENSLSFRVYRNAKGVAANQYQSEEKNKGVGSHRNNY